MDALPKYSLPGEPVVGDIKATLIGLVEDLELVGRGGRGRPRILPAMCLWVGFVVCVLDGFTSQRSVWRLLSAKRLWDFPIFEITDQAVYKRLKEGGIAPLSELFEKLSAVLSERLSPWVDRSLAPFAAEVVAIDATTLDPVARRLTDPTEAQTAPRPLAGRLLGSFDVRRQQWIEILFRPNPQENEKLHARDLLQRLPKGSLILADLGFFGFEWFDDLTDRGFWWLSRWRAKTSYRSEHVFYVRGEVRDELVWLGAHRADRAKHLVRRMQFRQGKSLRVFMTNVLDPHLLSIHDVANLYARRWDIEMAIQLVKEHLKLRLLWSNNTLVIQQQVWATLIIAQVAMAMRVEVAGRAQVDLFDVSLPLLLRYLPGFIKDHDDPVAFFVDHGRRLEFIRPSRRVQIEAPVVDPLLIKPPPDDLMRTRKPRYAGRRPNGPAS